MNFDLASTKIKVYKATITLVEIYHIIKFLKEEGFFEERKWWQGPHKDYLQYMKKSLFKKLDSDNVFLKKLLELSDCF